MNIRQTLTLIMAGSLGLGLQADLLEIPAKASNSLRGGNYVDTNYPTSMSASGRGSAPRKGLMKFDMSVVALDQGSSGTLKVTVLEAPSPLSVATMEVGVYALPTSFVPGSGILGYDWDPLAVTWNNAPGNAVDNVLSFTTDMDRVGTYNVNRADLALTQYELAIDNIARYIQPDNTITFGLAYEIVDLYYMKFGAWNEEPVSAKPYLAVNGVAQMVPWGPGFEKHPFTNNANTGDFLGWLYVGDEPWMWSYTLGCYLYFFESYLTVSGGWIYTFESDFAKLEWFPSGGGYGWSYKLNAWVYSASAAGGSGTGGWIYLFQ